MNGKTLFAIALAAMTTGGVSVSVEAQSVSIATVMTGLNNPRQLAVGPDGSLYVAEAGVGANGVTTGPSFVDGNQTTNYIGDTSGVSRLTNGVQTRLISDLPSVSDPTGDSAGGLTSIAFASNGTPYGVINFGGDIAARNALVSAGASSAQLLGTVVQLNFGSTPSATVVSDVSAYAAANNLEGATQPGKPNETNPYGLTALQQGGFAVTDAGGNFVATLGSNGTVNGVVKLPDYPNPLFPNVGGPTSQSVPTAVTQGPNGALYVAELGGFPFTPGASHIDVIQNGALVSRFGGFTTLVDVDYYDGELYALELTTNGLASPDPGPGSLLEVNPLTGQSTVLYSGLTDPGGLVVENADTFYISEGSTSAGGGSVILLAVPEPGACGLLVSFGLAGAGFLARSRRRNRQ